MPDDRVVAEVVHRELQAFVTDTNLDPCWRKLVSDLQALYLGDFGQRCVCIRPNGEFISFEYEAWVRDESVSEVRLEDDETVRTQVLFDGIKRHPSLRVLCPSRPPNTVVCSKCGGTGSRPEPRPDV